MTRTDIRSQRALLWADELLLAASAAAAGLVLLAHSCCIQQSMETNAILIYSREAIFCSFKRKFQLLN